MLVVMRHGAPEESVRRVVETIREMGYQARPMPGKQRTAIGLIGNDGKVDSNRLEALPDVIQVIHVTQPYKQVSREWRSEPTIVTLENGTRIGGNEEPPGVGVSRVVKEEVGGRCLHHPPQIHHRHPVRHLPDDGQIMGDDDI